MPALPSISKIGKQFMILRKPVKNKGGSEQNRHLLSATARQNYVAPSGHLTRYTSCLSMAACCCGIIACRHRGTGFTGWMSRFVVRVFTKRFWILLLLGTFGLVHCEPK